MPAPSRDESSARAPRAPAHRAVLLTLGWAFFALGAIGIVLPVVPTTPFMLLALWAFSASSPRFHDWLYHHRAFGPPLQRWRRERTIPPWAKGVAIGSMSASLVWLAVGVRPPWYVLAISVGVMLAGATFVLRIPSRR